MDIHIIYKEIKHVEECYEAYIMIRQSISWLHFLSDEYMYRKVENHQVSMSVCVIEFYRTSSTIHTITIVNIHLVSVLVCTCGNIYDY